MRKRITIAIISDIHSNIQALNAVFDDLKAHGDDVNKLVVNGDVIAFGPNPVECLQLLREQKNTFFNMGNNERYILEKIFDENTSFHQDIYDTIPTGLRNNLRWTREQLTEEDLDFIGSWKKQVVLRPHGWKLLFTHGTPNSDEETVFPDYPNYDLYDQFNKYDLYAFSHTHIPFSKKVSGINYLNTGSVGSPLDRDHRASYAVLYITPSNIQVHMRRIEYPLENTIKEIKRKNLPWKDKIITIWERAALY